MIGRVQFLLAWRQTFCRQRPARSAARFKNQLLCFIPSGILP
jgi:hypothetical protein